MLAIYPHFITYCQVTHPFWYRKNGGELEISNEAMIKYENNSNPFFHKNQGLR